MPLFLTCDQGHQWTIDEGALAPGQALSTRCAVCGGPATAISAGKPAAVPTLPSPQFERHEPVAKTLAKPELMSTEAPPPQPGVRSTLSVPGYTLIGELGRGGMGVVYKAVQDATQLVVALKMVKAGKNASSKELSRFRAEAEAVGRLHHPNIVQVFEAGDLDGMPYFAMEYVEGGSLAHMFRGRAQPQEKAALLVENLARAMHAAHVAGVIHRDLKPGNVLVTLDGTPKIADFGLAKQLDNTTELTSSGAILGTPNYMAPEQAEGRTKDIGPLTDVYALGAILYELLTGRPPFKGGNLVETLDLVRSTRPPPPRKFQPDLAYDVERICLKCLEKNPKQRYGSAHELAEDLGRFLRGDQVHARYDGGLLEEYLAEQHKKQLAYDRVYRQRRKLEKERNRQAALLWKRSLIVVILFVFGAVGLLLFQGIRLMLQGK